MKAYVINVSSSTERWKNVNNEFCKYNIIPTRIDASTKRGMLTDHEKSFVTRSCLNHCPHTGLAITFSHIEAWKTALINIQLDPNHPKGALICEDDIHLNNFHNFSTYLEEVPKDYDILYVGCLFCHDNLFFIPDLALRIMGKRKEPKNISEHVWIPPYVFGAHAYYVSQKGLEKLITLFSTNQIYDQIDIMLNDFSKKNILNIYATKPLIASQNSSLGASTQWKKLPSPQIANYLLDKILIAPEVTVAYGLSYPLKRIGEYEVNSWSIIIFLQGFVCGYLGFSSKWFPVSFIFNLFFAEFTKKSIINCITNICLFLFAYGIGLKLHSIKQIRAVKR